jgi:hypothetical protein
MSLKLQTKLKIIIGSWSAESNASGELDRERTCFWQSATFWTALEIYIHRTVIWQLFCNEVVTEIDKK